MTDDAGAVVNTYSYDAYGNLTDWNDVVPNPFRFVGMFGVMDDGNGLLYMRARYYDPEVGRFISKDPIGFAGGVNLYNYVGGNPVNWIDPQGLVNWSSVLTGGAVIVAGGATTAVGLLTGNPLITAAGIKTVAFGLPITIGGFLDADIAHIVPMWGPTILFDIGKGIKDTYFSPSSICPVDK